MTDAPRVTVLVPVHDQAAFLPRALASLFDQSVRDWQAWLLDDGSPDPGEVAAAVAACAGGDPRVRVERWSANRGLGAVLNEGLARAEAGVVAYLPADDVWYAGHLEALLGALAASGAALAVTGVRHHGEHRSLAAPPGHSLQLVQVAHRTGPERWTERAELESDDLGLLMWDRVRGRAGSAGGEAATGRVTCEWSDHPGQRHKAVRESCDGGVNVFRSRYRVAGPLRLHASDGGTTDEVARYARFRGRHHAPSPDGLTVVLAGELAYNPERVLCLAERGHRLHGLWTRDGLGFSTVGPLPFGHVADLPRDGWRQAMAALRPDVVHAQLNWRAVPFAREVLAEVRRSCPDTGFVWHFKEAPQRSIARGEWAPLAALVAGADACLLASDEEREWFALALGGAVDPSRLGVLDGDLPKAEWFGAGEPSPRLSGADGEPHTVVAGRPSGLDPAFVAALLRARVHVHLHGAGAAPGSSAAAWAAAVRDAAPGDAAGRLHVHPAVGPEAWVREFSRYDAGWLHRSTSRNGGDLRQATWDDLNVPARLPVLLGAGLPLLAQANPGHAVAVERVARATGALLAYTGPDDLVDLLRAEVATGAARAAARAAPGFTFDEHADRLVEVYRTSRPALA